MEVPLPLIAFLIISNLAITALLIMTRLELASHRSAINLIAQRGATHARSIEDVTARLETVEASNEDFAENDYDEPSEEEEAELQAAADALGMRRVIYCNGERFVV